MCGKYENYDMLDICWTFAGHHGDIAPMLLTIGINDFEFYITIFAQHTYLHASTFEKWLILKHMHPL